MVHFNKNENQPFGTFTFSVEGDNEDYMNTLISLLNLVSGQHENNLNCNDINNVNQLIISMLPDPDQIINKEDANIPDGIKQDNKRVFAV